MNIETLRFGKINVEQDALITFKDGLPGFSKLRLFCLIESTDDHLFMWLQSVDDPRVAFPVIEPQICSPQYKTPITEKDLEVLGVTNQTKMKVLCVVTIPDNPKDMTANLRAPIVISLETHRAIQVISSDGSYPMRHPIFNDLQRFVSLVKDEGNKAETTTTAPTAPATPFQIYRLKESDL